MKKKKLRHSIFFLFGIILAILIEVFGFNYRFWLSCGNKAYTQEYQLGSGLTESGNASIWEVADTLEAYIEIADVNQKVDYLYIDVVNRDKDGGIVPAKMTLWATDEGHSGYYNLGTVSTYPTVKKSQYVRIHTYGELQDLKICLDSQKAGSVEIHEIIINATVPIMFSVGRFFVIFMAFLVLWFFRPGSEIYKWKFGEQKKGRRILTCIVLLINTVVFVLLVQVNDTFMNPPWQHHAQYAMLAESFAEGRADLMIEADEALNAMDNPYDTSLRQQVASDAPWDIAYYEGKFYVYFGLVPELVFYFPYYMITGEAFPTYIGILLCAIAVLFGVFYLMAKIIKRWFPKTSVGVYLLLSLIMANGVGTLQILLDSRFYCLPVIMAIAFTIWGLAFWIGAADSWQGELVAEKRRNRTEMLLFAGSLCMALVAGCRPQFLLGSFFCIFLFWRLLQEDGKILSGNNIKKAVCFALPYVFVAAMLMYYNYIRFESPFDFGANYNLTTNDMTSRGFEWGRIPDGIYMYLLQLPNLSCIFPYVKEASYNSGYIGQVIRESMFGGVIFTHIFVWLLALTGKAKAKLKEKGLLRWTVVSALFSVVIVIADTQMAGILSRYYCDFIWLLTLPAVFVALQLWENSNDEKKRRNLIVFLLVAFFAQVFMDFFIGFASGISHSYSDPMYYRVLNWFL